MAYIWFDKMVASWMSPGLVASIGRKKYGKKAFQKAAATWTKMKWVKPLKKKLLRSKTY